ncbi:hypothetical protein V5O48_004962 [Marasmius crinis-equi]|uniref:Cell cycle checkpoint control protein RAD9A n=1 Tax=Marasmius crinis-equi TaxID=585013 RepID=A0ABR3FNP1_9AGAR
MTKALLSILKHHFGDSSVERCEISIVEGDGNETFDAEDEDSLESRLIVRLHCKHGVVKTHKLVLMTPQSLMAPGVPDTSDESLLTIGPRAMREIIEHFPLAKGIKADPQLIWSFEEAEVQATIAFAEASALALDLRFTTPAAPLFIDIEGDNFETLFVISTSQVQVSTSQQSRETPQPVKKRLREETPGDISGRFKKPMKAVQSTDRASMIRDDISLRSSVPPPSLPPGIHREPSRPPTSGSRLVPQAGATGPIPQPRDPLFLPSASQLTIKDENALRESGLGIENMTVDEFNAMMADDGEDDIKLSRNTPPPAEAESLDLIEDDFGLAPTQGGSSLNDQSKTFHPLFED